ncbi:MAG: hypothetical protein ABSF63_04135 [Candidatus Bathyarchaeia archaeon]|jgi:hypothetical protein
MQSRELVKELLNKFGVAVLAGASFGGAGENYLRFSFFMAPETIEEGMNKVKASKKHRESGRPTHLHTQLVASSSRSSTIYLPCRARSDCFL